MYASKAMRVCVCVSVSVCVWLCVLACKRVPRCQQAEATRCVKESCDSAADSRRDSYPGQVADGVEDSGLLEAAAGVMDKTNAQDVSTMLWALATLNLNPQLPDRPRSPPAPTRRICSPSRAVDTGPPTSAARTPAALNGKAPRKARLVGAGPLRLEGARDSHEGHDRLQQAWQGSLVRALILRACHLAPSFDTRQVCAPSTAHRLKRAQLEPPRAQTHTRTHTLGPEGWHVPTWFCRQATCYGRHQCWACWQNCRRTRSGRRMTGKSLGDCSTSWPIESWPLGPRVPPRLLTALESRQPLRSRLRSACCGLLVSPCPRSCRRTTPTHCPGQVLQYRKPCCLHSDTEWITH